MKKVKSLHVFTNKSHNATHAIRMRSLIIEHVLITFLTQLRQEYPKVFGDVKAIQIINRILQKNNGCITPLEEERLDDIVNLFYKTYPEVSYFHNHKHDSTQNYVHYPMIQYRCIKKKLVLVAFNEAVPILERWLSLADWKSWMSYKQVVDKAYKEEEITITEHPVYYRLMDWLALNKENYTLWNNTILLRDKIDILESSLTGHARAIASTFNEDIDTNAIHAQLVLLNKIKEARCFHHNDMAFNVICRVNLQLPSSLALGKSTSIGFGSYARTRWQGESRSSISKQHTEPLVIQR